MNRIQIGADADAAGRLAAGVVERALRERPAAVLALPTGATPRPLYRELVRRHREQGLSFAAAAVFGLDEYWPLAPEHPQSFRRFLRAELLDHVDLAAARFHMLDGGAAAGALERVCAAYEAALAAAGGIDTLLLGIGLNGHLGFNEPGAPRRGRTRVVELAELTRARAAADFGGEEVPRHGLTMGLGTILEARRIVVLATGAGKADIVALALAAAPDEALPASLLREHAAVEWILDRAAAARIER